ncbi:MAG: hypothetical protein IJG82_05260 [Atopobiaceae bacterium]|nr:hypothetical protein [Atopobiaceae bacterium]
MEKDVRQGSIFGDLTITQIIAGAAASATSFALAKQTGILGSVIGAAVGSVAATIAGALFTSMINRSVEGIRGVEAADGSATQGTVQLGSAPQPTRRSHKHALIALAIAMVAGLAAVWVYAAGVDIFTAGRGIGTQAPVVEYISGTYTEPEQDEEAVADETVAETENPAAEEPAVEPTPDAPVDPAPEGGEPAETPQEPAQPAEPTQPTADPAADAGSANGQL